MKRSVIQVDEKEKQGRAGEKQEFSQPAEKKVVTTLDSLPAGRMEDFGSKTSVKHPLPEGVTSKMLYRDILKIGWPALVELMLMQLTSMADLMMVGRLGPWAITAVGLTTQPKFLLSTAFIALNVGTMAMVGRYRGANNREKAKLVLRQAFMLNAVLGLFFCRRRRILLRDPGRLHGRGRGKGPDSRHAVPAGTDDRHVLGLDDDGHHQRPARLGRFQDGHDLQHNSQCRQLRL